MDILEQSLETQHYIYVAGEAAMNDPAQIAQAMGSAFGKAFSAMGPAGITPTSAPISVYTEMPGERMTFRCGFFVSPEDAGKVEGELEADQIPAGKVLHAIHVGPFTNLNQTHGAIWGHAKAAGLSSSMPVWEVYLDDPEQVDPEELRTAVYHSLR